MILLLSPAKRLNTDAPVPGKSHSLPENLDRSATLVGKLSKMSGKRLAALMDISPELAELNLRRFKDWSPEFNPGNAHPAILSFKGDVYIGLDATTLNSADLEWAQHHLRILSGLHGLLRPLDLMKPYRLEMGTGLAINRHKNLYGFWGNSISNAIQTALADQLAEPPVVLNLASGEYFKAVRTESLQARVIAADFREFKNGVYKPIQLFLKQARGYMTRWVIQNRITNPDELVAFDREGYRFDSALSTPDRLVFLRN